MSNPAQIVKMIADDFYGGKLSLSERGIPSYDDPWSQMPDVKFVEEMRDSGKYGCSHCENSGKRVPIGSACEYCQL